MYRQHLRNMSEIETIPAGLDPQIIARMSSLPLVHSACGQLCTLYQSTKDSHKLLKYTLETAETGVQSVAPTALAIVNKLEKPISALDSLACDGLDKLEQRVPLIKEPTNKVYEGTLKPVVDYSVGTVTSAKDYSVGKVNAAKDTITSVKTYSVDTVTSAKNYSVEKANNLTDYTYTKIDDVKTYGYGKIDNAKTYSYETLDNAKSYSYEKLDNAKSYSMEKVQLAMETPYGKVATQQMDSWLSNAEQYIDYYLPEAAEAEEKESSEEKAVTPQGSLAPLQRACTISCKARQRLAARAFRDLKNVQVRTKDALDRLHFNVDLIQYAKDNMGSVQSTMTTKLSQLWTEINASEEEAEQLTLTPEDAANTAATLERRAIATARHLTLRVKTGVSYLSSSVHLLPASVTDRVALLKTYSDDLYNSFSSVQSVSEVPDKFLTQAKDRLSYLQDTFSFLSDYIQTTNFINWMGLQGKSDAVTDTLEMEPLEQTSEPASPPESTPETTSESS